MGHAVRLEAPAPRGLGRLPALDGAPQVREGRGRDEERLLGRIAELALRLDHLLGVERRAVHAESALLRAAVADLGLHDHERRLVGDAVRRLGCAPERVEVVPVGHGLHVPAVPVEDQGHVVRERHVRGARQADAVGVVEDDQLPQLEVAGERRRLVGDALHEVAVAGEHVRAVVHDLVPRPVEPCSEVALGDRHAHAHREALAERAGRGLDARRVAVLRVAGGAAPPLPELLQIVERQVVAGEVQQAVEERRAVAGGKHEAVTVGPARVRRIVLHRPGEERVADGRGPEREARVAGVGLQHGVDGQRADRVDAELVERVDHGGLLVGTAWPLWVLLSGVLLSRELRAYPGRPPGRCYAV